MDQSTTTLYDQTVTHFTLRFFLRPDTIVDGQLVIELADTFRRDLLFPGCSLTSLWTKPPGLTAKLATGEFSEKRWSAAANKARDGKVAALMLEAQVPDFPQQKISFWTHVNPPGVSDGRVAGSIELLCSVEYLRHLAASPDKIEALLRLGRQAWDGVAGGPSYGFANIAVLPRRPAFNLAVTPQRFSGVFGPRAPSGPPAQRPHAIPVAHIGSEVDGNLETLFNAGQGIKGAFWANYLTAAHVATIGGRTRVAEAAADMRVEPLGDGGLLVVATESPLPDDTEENRRRFLTLTRLLGPAFLSRQQTPELKRPLLGYFSRE
jgi:hypothetical protein